MTKENNLVKTARGWKEKAITLLERTELIKDLSHYGAVYTTGAYAYDLMMHGDIDISVVREQPYTANEVFDIFKELYFKGAFRSYFIGGDWDDPRKGAEFPNGYYIGLKEKINSGRWKVDIWFISHAEYEKRSVNEERLKTITDTERTLILTCKEYRNANKLSVTGQEIYNAVLDGKWNSLDDFKKDITS